MLYVGHFWWEGEQNPNALWETRGRGWFTCAVEADSPDEATGKFEDLVTDLKSWFSSFEPVAYVLLDDFIEIKKLPSAGVLLHFTQGFEEFFEEQVRTTLPGVPPEFCEAYIPTQEGEDGELVPSEELFANFGEEEEEEEEDDPTYPPELPPGANA